MLGKLELMMYENFVKNVPLKCVNYSDDEKIIIAKMILTNSLIEAEDFIRSNAKKIKYTQKDDAYLDILIDNVDKKYTIAVKKALNAHEKERYLKVFDVYSMYSMKDAVDVLSNEIKSATARALRDFSIDKCREIALALKDAVDSKNDKALLNTFDNTLPYTMLAYYSMMHEAA